MKYSKDHRKKHREGNKKWKDTKGYQKYREKWYKKRKENNYQKTYQQNNPEKMKKYNKIRSNKKHNITKQEWINCKNYFNNSCVYCGITEEEHRKLFKQDLHKDHLIDDGRNDLKNCVPACKSCNSHKWAFTLNKWYSKENPNFTKEKYLKIYNWIRYDCKKYIEPKNINRE